MKKSTTLVQENSRIPYTNELANNCMDIGLSDQWVVYSLLANFDRTRANEEICIDIRNMARIMGRRLDSVRKQVAVSCMKLPGESLCKIDISTAKNKSKDELVAFEAVPIFRFIRFDPKSDMIIGRFNDEILPAIIATSESPIYKLTMTYGFSSQYTMRVLALIVSRYIASGKVSPVIISVTELMATVVSPKIKKGNKSLFRVSNFNQTILEKTILEINQKAYINIPQLEEIQEERVRAARGRVKTIAYAFHIEEKEGQSIETYADKENLSGELINRGFPKSLAEKTIAEKSWNTIRRNLCYFDKNVKKTGKSLDQLGKILWHFIENDTEKKNRVELTYVSQAKLVEAMPSLFDGESSQEESKVCKKCHGVGGYKREEILGNGPDTKTVWQVCDCKKKQPAWAIAD